MIGNIKKTFPPKKILVCEKSNFYKIQGISKTSKIHAACSVQNNVEDVEDIKTSVNRFVTDFLKFISLLSETSKMCMNYNVDSNMKSSNYSKIRFNP